MRLRKYFMYALIAVAVILIPLAVLAVWGFFIEPHLIDEKHETARIPDLPPEWEGKRIGLIADMQVGMWWNNADTIRRIVERLVAERPAAVLIAGDFIYNPTDEEEKEDVREDYGPEKFLEAAAEIDRAVALIRPLIDAGIPTYAVLGNHDYAMMEPDEIKLEWLAEETSRRLAAAGVRMIDNDAATLPLAEPGGDPLYIVGVGDKFARNDNVAQALSRLPDGVPRLALMHNPDSFAKFPPGAAPLALAGHTHGGQIRLPFTPNWSWVSLVKGGEVNNSGWIENYGQPGNSLYVNRGIGFSLVPVRINCRPEMTLITLYRAS